ncbi:capsular biosynthesis protein [Xenorhabdus stockiae]|uniref:Capsular biosynthesis protein n=1 Tax=Xenorhabdus stockiae TaxID=351614 RepID=A0A2D0KS02_9GAMM|nr:capsular biosynthesis protein [Xenorhabdus stockiae]
MSHSNMKKIIIDLDGTLTNADTKDYQNVSPRLDVIEKLINFRKIGYYIVINTARNMNSFDGNLGKINIHTIPIITEWLDKYSVPYDEIIVGKPWCGTDGFYVDDKAIRPDEFVNLSENEISKLITL